MTSQSHPHWLDHYNNIRKRIHAMKLLIILESLRVCNINEKQKHVPQIAVNILRQGHAGGNYCINILEYGPCIMFVTNKRCSEVNLYIWMLLDRYINVSLQIYGLAQVFCLGCQYTKHTVINSVPNGRTEQGAIAFAQMVAKIFLAKPALIKYKVINSKYGPN